MLKHKHTRAIRNHKAPQFGYPTDAVEVKVQVLQGLCLFVLEASASRQEQLVENAVLAAPGTTEADPYGAALWPSGQVLAQAVAAHA